MKKIILSCLMPLILVFVCDVTHAKTHVLLTVDVESFALGSPKENILGELDGYEGQYGVPKIVEILGHNNAKGTFYLNVYEVEKHGDVEIKKVAKDIVSSGHDLQLHSHPESMYGKGGLSDYPLSKQKEILLKGKKLISQWTGEQAVAHRAGAYQGNRDTIRALEQIGIILDSSLSPVASSPLFKEGFTANDVIEIDGVIEVPVTYFIQVKVGEFESARFLDIESTSLAEFKKVLSEFAVNDTCAVNVMMHSFSITRYGYPDKSVMDKLDSVLQFVTDHPDLEASTTSDFIAAYENDSLRCSPSPKFVPYTGFFLTYLRAWERFGDGWKNVAFALSLPGVAIVMLVTGITIRRFAR